MSSIGQHMHSGHSPIAIRRLCFSFAMVITLMVTGCKVEFTPKPSEPVRLMVKLDDKTLVQRDLGPEDGIIVQTFTKWLDGNRDGWKYAFIARPTRILLEGKSFSVNVRKDEVSLKYCHGPLSCHFWVKKDSELFQAFNPWHIDRLG